MAVKKKLYKVEQVVTTYVWAVDSDDAEDIAYGRLLRGDFDDSEPGETELDEWQGYDPDDEAEIRRDVEMDRWSA